MTKRLFALSIVALFAATACNDPTVPRLPTNEEEEQDTLPDNSAYAPLPGTSPFQIHDFA